MTPPSRPRGPAPRRLPRRVYWVRRLAVLAVLAVVVGVVYGVGRSLAGAWSGGDEQQVATPTSATLRPTPAAPTTGPSGAPAAEPTPGPEPRERAGATRTPLPEPEGVCPDSDVVVAPRVKGARLGQPIRIVLEVSTDSTPACMWEVGPDSVFLKVLEVGADAEEVVWSSQDCPALMPTAQVVARRQQAAEVVVSWSGQKSDPDCSKLPGWVHAGPFRAVSVARGAVTPHEEDFTIGEPAPEIVVLPSPEPSDRPTGKATAGSGDAPGEEPSEQR